MSAGIDEITQLVAQSLEAKGVMSKLKAQMLAAVFTTVDDKEREAGVHLERNPNLVRFISSPQGALIHGLVLEYLDALQLDATISVLKSEVGEVAPPAVSRDELASAIDADSSSSDPLLLQLYNKSA